VKSIGNRDLSLPRWALAAMLIAVSLTTGVGTVAWAQSNDSGQLPTKASSNLTSNGTPPET
jgi:hypothetical protein